MNWDDYYAQKKKKVVTNNTTSSTAWDDYYSKAKKTPNIRSTAQLYDSGASIKKKYTEDDVKPFESKWQYEWEDQYDAADPTDNIRKFRNLPPASVIATYNFEDSDDKKRFSEGRPSKKYESQKLTAQTQKDLKAYQAERERLFNEAVENRSGWDKFWKKPPSYEEPVLPDSLGALKYYKDQLDSYNYDLENMDSTEKAYKESIGKLPKPPEAPLNLMDIPWDDLESNQWENYLTNQKRIKPEPKPSIKPQETIQPAPSVSNVPNPISVPSQPRNGLNPLYELGNTLKNNLPPLVPSKEGLKAVAKPVKDLSSAFLQGMKGTIIPEEQDTLFGTINTNKIAQNIKPGIEGDGKFIQGSVQSAVEGFIYGDISNKLAMEYYKASLGRENKIEYYQKMLNDNPQLQAEIPLDFKQALKDKDVGGIFKHMVRGMATQVPMWVQAWKSGKGRASAYGLTAAGTTAVAGQLGPQALLPEELITVPVATGMGATAGQATGMFEYFQRLMAGQSYKDMTQMGISPDTARVAAPVIGAVNAAIEQAEFSAVIKLLPGGKQVMAGIQGTVKNRALNALKNYGTFMAKEAIAEELGQEVVTIAGEEISKAIDNLNGSQLEYASKNDIFSRLGETAKESVLSFALMPIPGMVQQTIGNISTNATTQTETSKQFDSYKTNMEAMNKHLEKIGSKEAAIEVIQEMIKQTDQYIDSANKQKTFKPALRNQVITEAMKLRYYLDNRMSTLEEKPQAPTQIPKNASELKTIIKETAKPGTKTTLKGLGEVEVVAEIDDKHISVKKSDGKVIKVLKTAFAAGVKNTNNVPKVDMPAAPSTVTSPESQVLDTEIQAPIIEDITTQTVAKVDMPATPPTIPLEQSTNEGTQIQAPVVGSATTQATTSQNTSREEMSKRVNESSKLTDTDKKFYEIYTEQGSSIEEQISKTQTQLDDEKISEKTKVVLAKVLESAKRIQSVLQGTQTQEDSIETQKAQPVNNVGQPTVNKEQVSKKETPNKNTAFHYTLPENVESILNNGFDVKKDPLFGVREGHGKDANSKFGSDVIYLTRDKNAYSKAKIPTNDGTGNADNIYYDYDNQKWITEKNGIKEVDTVPIEFNIDPKGKRLLIDSVDKFKQYGESIDSIVEYAKGNGYDYVELMDGKGWERKQTTKHGDTNWYDFLTGGSGKNDLFIINKSIIKASAASTLNQATPQQAEPTNKAPEVKKETPKASTGGTLKDHGLNMKQTSTKNGKPVWELSGTKKEDTEAISAIKKAGGRWYGPKRVWSFYGEEDPSTKILEAMGGSKAASSVSDTKTATHETAPTTTPEVKISPLEDKNMGFKEGERITFNKNGKTLTGTIRSFSDYSDIGNMGMMASVDVDQIALAGGVPIQRIELVSLKNIKPFIPVETPVKNDTNNEESGIIKPKDGDTDVRKGDKEQPSGVPTEDLQGTVKDRPTRIVSSEEGEGGRSKIPPNREEPANPVSETNNEQLPGKTSEKYNDSSPNNTTTNVGDSNAGSRGNGRSSVATNFRITTDDDIGAGGIKTKYKDNIAAIKLLKQLESEQRLATSEEQAILARYVGWGGMSQAFSASNATWMKEYKEVKDLLTDEEYKAAKGSTLNAHYTDIEVIKTMYDAVSRLGFDGGRILEPAMGVGNFLGAIPDNLIHSKLTGIELDSLTGRIAKQLYQKATIHVKGFEAVKIPDNFFDIAISNVPFGDYTIHDPQYNKHNFLIHDYFFAKSLDKVRPGGIVAFITSKGTMDKKNSKVRQYISDRADLIGAIRLPNTTFQKNANTSVTTDVIFLQKREPGQSYNGEEWISLGKTSDGVPVNRYFEQHPDMMLGTMAFDSSMYGNETETTLNPIDGDLLAAFKEAISILPENIMNQTSNTVDSDIEPFSLLDNSNSKENAIVLKDGKIYQNVNGELVPLMQKSNGEMIPITGKRKERIIGMINIRDAMNEVFNTQRKDLGEVAITNARKKLNSAYDKFVKQHGHLDEGGNKQAFRDDPDYPRLTALEEFDADKGQYVKADIFSKRTIIHKPAITKVGTSSEGLAVSLNDKGRVDIDNIAKLVGKSREQVIKDLQGIIFNNPVGEWETADAYLSGNVREKLTQAQIAAELDPAFDSNVKALENVQPTDLKAHEISVRLGSNWIGTETVEEFISEMLDTTDVQVSYIKQSSTWNVNVKASNTALYAAKFGTGRMYAQDIVKKLLNMGTINIYDTDVDGTKTLNKKETALAREKSEVIKREFASWVYKDSSRRQKLEKTYNTIFNSVSLRKYDGSFLSFPGMTPNFIMRDYQKNVVARILFGGNTLVAHAVGAGKTAEMVAAGMELKRLGIAHKPVYVVPNHMIEQWRKSFLSLYPNANVLAATKKDFEKSKRGRFVSMIATGNWDAVIISHSSFGRIGVSKETEIAFIQEEIDDVLEAIRSAEEEKDAGSRKRTVKDLEAVKKKLESKMQQLMESETKDTYIDFEDLGIDYLFVDEAHNFKNLFFHTKMGRIAGVTNGKAKRASDMYMKTKYITGLHNNERGIVFATGTPISNSMPEMFTMQKYLQMPSLDRAGLKHFDAWAGSFGETVSSLEVDKTGRGFRTKQRFNKFFNAPELITMFRDFADVITSDMLTIERPTIQGGKATVISVEPGEDLVAYIDDLIERSDAVSKGLVDSTEDNALKITNDGRLAALDMRLIDPSLPDNPNSKLNMAVEQIFKEWEDGKKERTGQLVFSDLGTPKKQGNIQKVEKTFDENGEEIEEDDGEEGPGFEVNFDIYHDIKGKLVKMGIPENEIAFIHDAKTDIAKDKLFEKVRRGQVRILLGSTGKMGEGTNVQDRLIALHHLDAPWKPASVEQRNGRIVRSGNRHKEVRIFHYVTKGSFDAYIWQLIENKARFISQMMNNRLTGRQIEDAFDDVVLNSAEIKAAASQDPRIMEKVKIDQEVNRLEMLKAAHMSQVYDAQDRISRIPQQIRSRQQYLENVKKDIAKIVDTKGENFSIILKGKNGNLPITDRKEAGEILQEAALVSKRNESVVIGQLSGFDLIGSKDSWGDGIIIVKGANQYETKVTATPNGTAVAVENVIRNLPKESERTTKEISSLQDRLKTYQEESKKPFEYDSKLTEIYEKQASINNSLNLEKNDDVIMDEVEEDEDGNTKATVQSSIRKEDTLLDNYITTNSKQFKRWFGASKVVDSTGKPMVVYHGTTSREDFSTFEPSYAPGWGTGIYFTDNPKATDDYAYDANGRVIPVYVKIQNPFTGKYPGDAIIEKTKAWIKYRGYDENNIPDPDSDDYNADDWNGFENPHDAWSEEGSFANNVIRELGYDGIIAKNSNNINGLEIVAFKSEQIKSAIANDGSFDANEPSILSKANKAASTDVIGSMINSATKDNAKPISRSEIEKFISDKLDIPITQGKFRQHALGIFKVKPEVIRLKNTKDLETLYHETGHFLDKELGLYDKRFKGELMDLGQPVSRDSYTDKEVIKEGIAQFVMYYTVDNNKVKQSSPQFYAFFETKLNENPNIKDLIGTLQAATKNYIEQDPMKRILGNVSLNGQKPNLAEKVNLHKLYTSVFDELHPLQQAVQKITGGERINAESDPFLRASLLRGVAGKIEAILKYGPIDGNNKKLSKGFEEIIQPIEKDLDTFRAYAVAKHAKELMDKGKATGINIQDINYAIRKYDAEYEPILKELVEFQNNVLKQLVDSGVLSAEGYQNITEAYEYYIPFQRVIDTTQGGGKGKGYQARNPVHRIKGSTRDIIDPLESIIKNTFITTTMADRNRVGKSLADLADKYEGSGKVMDKVPPRMIGKSFTLDEIAKVLREAGVETEGIDMDAMATVFRPTGYTSKDNVITVFNNGDPTYYEVFDDDLYRAFTAMDKEKTPDMVIKILSIPANILRAGATGLNPDFISRNILRDTVFAGISSQYNFIPFIDSLKGLAHVLKQDDVFQKWLYSSAANSEMVSVDRDNLKKMLEDLFDTSAKSKAMNIVTHPLDIIRALSAFSEDATRVGVYAKALKKEGDSVSGMMLAGLASRETTLDFNKFGKDTRNANKIIAFFNATLHGNATIINAFRRDKAKFLMRSLLYITLPSIALYMMNHDDPEYEQMQQYQKDLFWMFKAGDVWLRIPKPPGLGMIFGTLPERFMDYMIKENPKAMDGWKEQFAGDIFPNFVPTALLPWMEVVANYDTFRKINIVPQSERYTKPSEQYSAYTSTVAKAIGQIFNLSPRKIDHLIKGYAAGVGTTAAQVVGKGLEVTGLVKGTVKPDAPWQTKVPILKGLVVEPYRSSKSIDDLYSTLDDLEKEYNQLKGEKDIELSQFPKASQLRKLRKTRDLLTDIRRDYNKTYADNKISSAQKKKKLSELNMKMINLSRQALGKPKIKE